VTGKPQISKNDRFMDGSQALDGFEFDNDSTLDKQINSITAIEFYVLVDNRHRPLALYPKIPQVELFGKALFVCGLKQAGAEESMDFDRRAYDLVRDFIVRHKNKNLTQRTQRTDTELTEKPSETQRAQRRAR
jgi:hypothetical protein